MSSTRMFSIRNQCILCFSLIIKRIHVWLSNCMMTFNRQICRPIIFSKKFIFSLLWKGTNRTWIFRNNRRSQFLYIKPVKSSQRSFSMTLYRIHIPHQPNNCQYFIILNKDYQWVIFLVTRRSVSSFLSVLQRKISIHLCLLSKDIDVYLGKPFYYIQERPIFVMNR